jgi:hypothetical protein
MGCGCGKYSRMMQPYYLNNFPGRGACKSMAFIKNATQMRQENESFEE